jgi:hypothetical protein
VGAQILRDLGVEKNEAFELTTLSMHCQALI